MVRVTTTAVGTESSSNGPDRQSTTTAFNGGEGAWVHGRSLFFTTKGNNRVYELGLDSQQLTILYDVATTSADADPIAGLPRRRRVRISTSNSAWSTSSAIASRSASVNTLPEAVAYVLSPITHHQSHRSRNSRDTFRKLIA